MTFQMATSLIFLNTPTFLNVTISSCPKGFLLMGDVSSCSCLIHQELTNYNIDCSVIPFLGLVHCGLAYQKIHMTKYKSVINVLQITVMLTRKVSTLRILTTLMVSVPSTKLVDCVEAARTTIAWLLDRPMYCIHCPNNNNLALIIFFAAAVSLRA